MHVHIYEPRICTYAYIKYVCKIFFQFIFLLTAPGRRLGAVTFIMCVCVRALARVRMSVCACTWAPFSEVTFTVCTAGGKDSVVLSDTSCTCV